MENDCRLIDANALAEQIHEEIDKYYLFVDAFEYLLENAPTVDAVEAVHGRWDRVKFFANATLHHCSICGHAEIKTYNYCPNCGAKMDGDVDG